MYKLGKWLHALGARNARDRLKAELFYYLSWQPERRTNDEVGWIEDEKHYNKRVDEWFAARKIIEEFFDNTEGSDRIR